MRYETTSLSHSLGFVAVLLKALRVKLVVVAVVTILVLLLAPLVLAQFPSAVNNDTRTPVEGSGHDYIKMLTETVDPSNGSLTVHIAAPVPPSRGITIPFSFDYSSGAVLQVQVSDGEAGWAAPNVGIISGGWSYRIPALTANQQLFTCYPTDGGSPLTTYGWFNYIFTDPSGGRHNLGLASIATLQPDCAYVLNPAPYSVYGGGDDFYSASLSGGGGYNGGAVTVQGVDGTVYNFAETCWAGNFGVNACLPSTIVDRNGNVVTISEGSGGNFTETDTAGRPAVSTSAPVGQNGSVSISGLSNGYTMTWETVNSNYGSQYDQIGNGPPACNWLAAGANINVIKSIELPNGKYYTFAYDSYGLLNQITYPSGAVVQYTRTIPSSPNGMIAYYSGGMGGGSLCMFGYYAPMVATRTVMFDGVHTALFQQFTYTTAYNTGVSQATVQTTVYSSNGSTNLGTFKTVYNYASTDFPFSDPDDPVTVATSTPMEQTVQYYDYGQTNLLETKTEGWQDQFRLGCRLETHDGSALYGTFYSYGAGLSLTDQKEYDYGQIGSTSACPQAPGGGQIAAPSGITPLRETITTYQVFGNTGPAPSDRPCSVVTNGSGTKTAETDYLYDGGTSVCGTAGTPSVSSANNPVQHNSAYAYNAVPQPPRGNVSSVIHQCTLSGSACSTGNPTTTYTYDETGQALSMKDPNGNTTQYSFADSYTSGTPPGNTNAYLTTITNPLNQNETFSYNYNTGELTVSKDQNDINAGRAGTTYVYNDPFARPTQANYPDGGQTNLLYNDTAPSPTVTTCQLINGTAGATCSATSPPTGWKTTLATMDGLGHPVQNELVSDPDGATFTATSYDGLGETYQVYNPTRCPTPTTNCGTETTWGYSTYTHDALGRTKSVTKPDGSVATTTYSSNQTTVTDEVGNQRTNQNDALARLTYVWEAPNVTGYNFETIYQYDALNDLLNVTQNGSNLSYARVRSFVYDSLARLTSATNPESGTITYSYDLNSNLSTKVAPKANQTGTTNTTTSYTYDALNRLTKKTYSSPTGPEVQFGYDGTAIPAGCGQDAPHITSPTNLIGRRSAMCDGESGSSASYDPMGRPLLETTINAGGGKQTSFSVGYTYNLDGSLNLLTYPSGDVLTYTPGGAGRMLGVSDSTNTYVDAGTNHATYAPHGALTTMLSGDQNGFEGIGTWNTYNPRLQPILMSAILGPADPHAPVTVPPIFSLCFDFHSQVALNSGPCSFNAYTSPNGNNGNVYQILNNVDSTRSAAYIYDPLNRIAQAYTLDTSSSNCWGETYATAATAPGVLPPVSNAGIDSWGNLFYRSGVTGMATNCNTEGLSATVTTQNQLGGIGVTYDAAGNVTNDGNGNQPTYDTENRISTDAGVTYYYDADGARMEKSSGTKYWFGPDGEVLTETSLTGTINEEYVYFNGQRIARIDRPSGTVNYYFSNHLDSASVITSATGSIQEQTDFYPFGGVAYVSGSDPNHYKFTGKERDSESGLDNFDFRYYGSSLGRFMTPDDDSAQDAANPQSWNLYSYVMNRPTVATDPDGHDCIYIDNDSGKMTGFNSGDCDNSTEEKANSGVYVNGTVNSIELNSQDQVIGYSGTGEQFGVFTMGVIQPPGATPPPQVTDPGMLPGMLGPGDLVLFSGVKVPSVVTDLFGKLFGSILGKSAEEAAETAAKIVPDVDNLSNKIVRQMVTRGWTKQEILDTVNAGKAFPVVNKATGGAATEYVGASGKFVVVDNATRQVIQVSGPGFLPNHLVQ
jgi:RHS repeat-associated protein